MLRVKIKVLSYFVARQAKCVVLLRKYCSTLACIKVRSSAASMQQIQDENDEPNPDLAQACLMTGFFIQLRN